MQQIFDRIHTQFARLKEKYQSDMDLSFNDGATDDDFAKLEKVLGFELPNDFKEIYRIHNGSYNLGVFVDESWFSIDDIIIEYQIWIDLYNNGDFKDGDGDCGCSPEHNEIKADFWFNPKWIPLTGNGCGDSKMIDLDPSETGTVGQIIQMWHDEPSRTLEAVSLKVLFEQFATDLENDEYIIHPEYEGIVRADEV
ncbi:SMI1 / KNR4 family [Moraxella lacunata]|uniref:SMI1 / KNR4 family n=1 Tax=Moraxella lacunata TaxID=477 RepID=A0A378TRI5_MORLA|nr:SMI1/KNR4 family protein [Moraxella lacunata]STZ63261.1 SMI1 / KNR4 family [Moraxella lacunata]